MLMIKICLSHEFIAWWYVDDSSLHLNVEQTIVDTVCVCVCVCVCVWVPDPSVTVVLHRYPYFQEISLIQQNGIRTTIDFASINMCLS